MGKHARIAAGMARRKVAADSPYHPCYLEYFRLFNEREYYAAHDVLEHIWLGSADPFFTYYKALIQFAGGFVHLQHHHREPHHRIHSRRLRPAARLFLRSAELLGDYPQIFEGIRVDSLRHVARNLAEKLTTGDYRHNPWTPEAAPRLTDPR